MGRRLKLDDKGNVQFFELASNGTNKVTLQAPDSLAADYTLTLPADDGAASQFLQTDGAGVLTWANSTATLQSAYTNGAKIDADGTVVEIEVAAASGNTALLLDQDDDQKALDITKDGTGAGDALAVLNAGTGRGVFIDQDGAGIGLLIDQDGNAVALSVDQAAVASGAVSILNAGTGVGLLVNQDGAAIGLSVDQDGAAIALDVNQGTDNVALNVVKAGAGAGNCVAIENDGTGTGLFVAQDGAGIAVDIDQDGGALALQINQATNNGVVDILKAGAGAGVVVDIENDGTGICLFLDQDGNGTSLSIDSEATGAPLINLAPVTGNTRGDIAFGTARTADPASSSEGDIWYDGTLARFKINLGGTAQEQTIKSIFGFSFGPPNQLAISSGVLTVTTGHTVVEAETGVTDTLVTINSSPSSSSGDVIMLTADTTDTITVASSTDNIILTGDANRDLGPGGAENMILVKIGSNWVELGASF